MCEDEIRYEEWTHGYTAPEGRIIVEDSVEGEYGEVWVGVIETPTGDYCVFCRYSDAYQPPSGDEYYYTKDRDRALAEYKNAIANVEDWIREKDDYEKWLDERVMSLSPP